MTARKTGKTAPAPVEGLTLRFTWQQWTTVVAFLGGLVTIIGYFINLTNVSADTAQGLREMRDTVKSISNVLTRIVFDELRRSDSMRYVMDRQEREAERERDELRRNQDLIRQQLEELRRDANRKAKD